MADCLEIDTISRGYRFLMVGRNGSQSVNGTVNTVVYRTQNLQQDDLAAAEGIPT